jgi:hypothetical protein
MRKIVSAAVAALLATGTSAWTGSTSGSIFSSTSMTLDWTLDVPLEYETNYYSGIGPYYSDNIFTDIDDTMHYEEYGFDFDFYAQVGIYFYMGDISPDSTYYFVAAFGEADVLQITPYKQTVWFQRPVAEMMAGGSSTPHMWVGGAYQVATGEAYLSYEENAYTGVGDLWNAGAWTVQYPDTDTTYLSSWDDPVYYVNVIDYLPSNFQTYITEYQLYEQQLF